MLEVKSVFSYSIQRGEIIELTTSNLFDSDSVEFVKQPDLGTVVRLRSKIVYRSKKDLTGSDYFIFSGKSHKRVVQYLVAVSIGDIVFKPRARLLIQLGEKLIQNESIALTELVKNSYDADASYCKVNLLSIDNRNEGKITIDDDGWGMDIDTIRNAWLEPGSDNKEEIIRSKEYSPKGRLPIGEKGIGRFGVHKLGREIELITRKANCDEVVVKINWEEFEKHRYLDKAPVAVIERKPEIFKGDRTGTRITISRLTNDWTRGMLRDAFRAINSTSIPLTYDIDDVEEAHKRRKSKNAFEALPSTNLSTWISDIPKWQDIIQYAFFFFDIEIEDDNVLTFSYKFRPWENMKKISGRKLTEKNKELNAILEIPDLDFRKYVPLKIGKDVQIGKVKFQGCVFVKDKSILKTAIKKPAFLTEYLNENGGIRVYRNGLRIYDYGERGNDWLNLDFRRFNDPGVKISNNMLLASITIDRETSSGLIEKTNREGFIDNESYRVFKNQILYSLRLVEICREPDKKRLDAIYKPTIETEPVLKSIENLRSFAKEKIVDKKTNQQLNVYIDRVETNYKFIYDKLVKTASAGLGWGIYIHEIEKIIKEIEKCIGKPKEEERAIKLVSHLSKLIESYAQILRKSTRTKEDLKKLIEQSLFNIEFRFEAHGIMIMRDFIDFKGDALVKVSRNLIVATLMNLFDNSIYWLDRAGRKNKTIRIAITDEIDGFVSIVVSDNGTGFLMSPEEMIEPLMSARGGMGMGLHLANEVMEGHSGKLSFNEYEDIDVPKMFKQGGTVILSFKI
jgi:hypothetical protein